MEQVITAVDGQTCTAWRPVRLQPGETYEERQARLDRSLGPEGWAVWNDLVGRYPTCASLRARPPEEVAASFVRTIVPPGPEPRIDPGFAITGKPAYLQTTGPTTDQRRLDTPLGPLVVRLRAVELTVDWGDGSGVQGPFAAPARPWPRGEVTHAYAHRGRYDVVVIERWVAHWSVAGRSGTLAGLTSTGRINRFEVRELQAVRER